jgi:RNA polymerase sigma-70 factor (ECF subfamily)
MPDPALKRAIAECVGRLPKQPGAALRARVNQGDMPDRDLARDLKMKLNTFRVYVGRARKLVAKCLERRGIRLSEILS